MRLLLVTAAAFVLAAGPATAEASKASRWKRVLRAHDVRSRTGSITVRPGHFGRSTVSVRIRARAVNTEPVQFPDALYGATAYRWTGRRWRRVDDAPVRPAIVKELTPGQAVRVRLPLRHHPRRVRILVPVTADRAGAWTDVIR